jgi:flagellar hook-associated protein 1 FlgK
MRATFFGIELGKRAILTQRTAMEVTSHNIANANTEGYSRQAAVLGATGSWSIPGFHAPVTAQQIGTGVDVTTIESFRNAFIDEKILKEKSTLEQRAAADDLMKEIEAIFNEPNDATLRDQLDKFWAAWENLSVSPATAALRQNVVEEAQSLVSLIQDFDLRLTRLQGTPDHSFQGSIENQIEDALRQVNSLGKQIATLNNEIERIELANGRANDLRDQRQKLMEELSELINVESSYDSKGHLTIRNGVHVLVQHNEVRELSYQKKTTDQPGTICFGNRYPEFSDDPSVASAVLTHTASQRNITMTVEQVAQANSQFSFLTFHPLTGPLSTFGVTSGTFQLQGREFYLDAENTTMSDLVTMINEANIQVKASLNESGQLNLESALTGTDNAIKAANGTSTLWTVMNMQEHKAAKNAVFNIGSTRYERQSNEVSDALSGVTLFVKGVGVANMDLRPIVTNGKLQGLLEVRDGQIETIRDSLNEFTWKLVTEVNAAHRQGFGLDGVTGRNFFTAQLTDDAGDPYKDAMTNLAIEDFILSDVNALAASGGSLANPIDRLLSYNGDGDGSNAILIAQIKQKNFFNTGKTNFSEFYNEMVTKVATRSQTAARDRQSSDDLLVQLDSKRQELSGVSLDEELANLIRFQHAYNAASRVITTMDSMLDKIINGMLR